MKRVLENSKYMCKRKTVQLEKLTGTQAGEKSNPPPLTLQCVDKLTSYTYSYK